MSHKLKSAYYIYKDYQGSYQTITNSSGATVETLSFDPWSRRRNATNWTYNSVPTSFTFDRGYTGHEHIDAFVLINMNGRVYDPVTAHFLSPDPVVQAPNYTQSYNRFSYCLNNPMKYTDPSGYSWWSHFTGWVGETAHQFGGWLDEHNIGETLLGYAAPSAGPSMIKGALFNNEWDITMHGSSFNNSSRIFLGLFAADTKQSGWGWQIVSRFTWESPQTALGFVSSNMANNFGNVNSVNYYAGATVVQCRGSRLFWGWKKAGTGMTLGSYIIGNNKIEANANNPLF